MLRGTFLLLLIAGCAQVMPSRGGDTPRPIGSKADGAGLAAFAPLAVGASHACAVLEGAVHCWGWNRDGQLGDGTRDDRAAPTLVLGVPTDVVELAAGKSTTCAVTSQGAVECWGAGLPVRIDLDNADIDDSAINVMGATTIDGVHAYSDGGRSLAVGSSHACAIDSGAVACWGGNIVGQLGDGSTAERTTPGGVSDLDDAIDIDAWGSATCVATRVGEVYCWGAGNAGPVPGRSSTTPVRVEGVEDIVQVDVGSDAACAVTSNGELLCWGGNVDGQLGLDPGGHPSFEAAREEPPTQILDGVASVAVGDRTTCATRFDGEVVCFGNNIDASLGVVGLPTGLYDEHVDRRFTPQPPIWFTPRSSGQSSAIYVENDAWLAAYRDHFVATFGHDYTVTRYVQPNLDRTPVDGLYDAQRVAVGAAFACALRSGGGIACWGSGALGQLGDGLRLGQSIDSSGTRRFPIDPRPSTVAIGHPGCGAIRSRDPYDWERDDSNGATVLLGLAYDDGRFDRVHPLVDYRRPSFAVQGNLYPSSDIDWFDVEMDDGSLASLDPRIDVAGGVRVCAYYDPPGTTGSVQCADGAQPAALAVGDGRIEGCCKTGSFGLTVDASGRLDDSGRLVIAVDEAYGSCGEYTLSLSF